MRCPSTMNGLHRRLASCRFTLAEGVWISPTTRSVGGFKQRFTRPSDRPSDCPELRALRSTAAADCSTYLLASSRPCLRTGASCWRKRPRCTVPGQFPRATTAAARTRFEHAALQSLEGALLLRASRPPFFRGSPASLPNPPDVFRHPSRRDLRTTLPRQSMTSQQALGARDRYCPRHFAVIHRPLTFRRTLRCNRCRRRFRE